MQLSAVLTPAEEGGYIAHNPETFTTSDGETIEEALANLKEAVELYLEDSPLRVRGNEILTEESTPGSGFLAEVCKEWEAATAPAEAAGIRVVNLRIGAVLTPKGGALGKQLFAFRAGLGAVLGTGKQWVPWVTVHDVVGAIHHCVQTDSLSGPVNAIAPNPVINREFSKSNSKRPMRSHLRDSGQIEQDADKIMLMHYQHYWNEIEYRALQDSGSSDDVSRRAKLDVQMMMSRNEIEVIVDKNRRGQTNAVKLFCDLEYAHISDAEAAGSAAAAVKNSYAAARGR